MPTDCSSNYTRKMFKDGIIDTMKPLLVVLSGLPFSGKSTLAKQLSEMLGLPILNYDSDVYAKHKHEVPEGASAAQEFELIEAIARKYLTKKLSVGNSLIYDDLGLQREDRYYIRQVAETCGAKYVLVFLDTPIEVIEKRRKANRGTNGREDIDTAKLQLDISLLEKPQADESAIIVYPGTPVERIVTAIQTRRR